MRALQPPGWPEPRGYANGIEANGIVFTGGMIGWDETGAFPHADLAGQAGQALRNVVAVLAEAGAKPEDVVRLTWYITDREEYLAHTSEIGSEYRAVMGRHFPAMAVVEVSGLLEAPAKVEIEATAVLRRDRASR
jgi:enamine deaminase RidA (YjgF/YER057c/UK114 family)